jgi:hypothetical protein
VIVQDVGSRKTKCRQQIRRVSERFVAPVAKDVDWDRYPCITILREVLIVKPEDADAGASTV